MAHSPHIIRSRHTATTMTGAGVHRSAQCQAPLKTAKSSVDGVIELYCPGGLCLSINEGAHNATADAFRAGNRRPTIRRAQCFWAVIVAAPHHMLCAVAGHSSATIARRRNLRPKKKFALAWTAVGQFFARRQPLPYGECNTVT